jgi:hypothetical protein
MTEFGYIIYQRTAWKIQRPCVPFDVNHRLRTILLWLCYRKKLRSIIWDRFEFVLKVELIQFIKLLFILFFHIRVLFNRYRLLIMIEKLLALWILRFYSTRIELVVLKLRCPFFILSFKRFFTKHRVFIWHGDIWVDVLLDHIIIVIGFISRTFHTTVHEYFF